MSPARQTSMRCLPIILMLFIVSFSNAQKLEPNICFDFNKHNFREKNGKLISKAVGVSLAEDRFGNKESAIRVDGHASSYFNLGTSTLLKPEKGTIALWVRLDRPVYTGKGYFNNPIIITKNSDNPGWFDAYVIAFDGYNQRFGVATSLDEASHEVVTYAKEQTAFNVWYHLAMTFDDDSLSFYVNGQLQKTLFKGFKTVYNPRDSVMIGYLTSQYNERYSQGDVDDIMIFHRALKAAEIKELYKAPDPNRFARIVNLVLKFLLAAAVLAALVFYLIHRNKKKLKKEKEELELKSRINELEMQVIKAQMNPHFISNCLAAIQDLIYNNEVDKAGQYLAKFSFFLRQMLNYSDRTYITLKEELEIIKLNVELEQLRFRNNFDFSLEIDGSIKPEQLKVPSLISQPCIENAIWHGLLPLKESRKPKLIVRAHLMSEVLVLEIEDNGIGRKNGKVSRDSKGTRLVRDKLDTLNRLTESNHYKMTIIDIINEQGETCGTKVILQLDLDAE